MEISKEELARYDSFGISRLYLDPSSENYIDLNALPEPSGIRHAWVKYATEERALVIVTNGNNDLPLKKHDSPIRWGVSRYEKRDDVLEIPPDAEGLEVKLQGSKVKLAAHRQ